MNTKDDIRKLIKRQKTSLSNIDKKFQSDLVFNKLFQLREWNNAYRILAYYSLPDELQTIDFLDSTSNKELFIPRINGNTLDITYYNKNNLKMGAFNIWESNSRDTISVTELDMIIVPGVAFDRNKNRLGRGKGFYDRLLANTNAIKIGVCYDFQLLNIIPTVPHDIKMDIIITPSFLIF